MVTINVTKDQADEIYRALNYLYESYDPNDEYHNEFVNRYNNTVDEIKIIVKEAITNESNTEKANAD